MADSVNPALLQKLEEIDNANAELRKTQDEINFAKDRLNSLQKHEASLQQNLFTLQSQRRAMLSLNTRAVADTLNQSLQEDEEKMRELQNQISSLSASRETKLQELNKIKTLGETETPAGAPMRANADIARYDLVVEDVRTGLSHDPLAQTPSKGKVGSHFDKRSTEGFAVSIDNIGNHVSASPYVKPEDYKVEGERPTTGNASAKFADWHSNRSGTRVAQPPGGYSNMGSIFG